VIQATSRTNAISIQINQILKIMPNKPSKVPTVGISYLLDAGNSNVGPVGFCARVTLPGESTKDDALAHFRKHLVAGIEGIPAFKDQVSANADRAGLEYVNIYINSEALTLEMITESEPVPLSAG
jgi:hypothetical protein